MIKKRWIIIPVLAGLMVFSFTFKRTTPQDDKNDVLMNLVVQGLNASHYATIKIDDSFSQKTFDLFIKRMDYYKRFITKEDLKTLDSYRNKIDDEMLTPNYDFLNAAMTIVNDRMKQSQTWCTDILSKPMDLNGKDKFETDPEKREFAGDEKELKTRWEQMLEYQVMQKMSDLINEDKAAGQGDASIDKVPTTGPAKSLDEYQEEARTKVLKTYTDYYQRISKLNFEDQVSDYINAITSVYDPHTEYFPPADKDNFDIQMSGQLEGIGAQLSEKDGFISVENVIPGSPCWKQGDLKEGDLIIKVGQGNEEPVDIVDWRVDDAVKLIRGKKGTEVRLTVKHVDGSIKVVPITRDVVILQDTYAKSAIVRHDDKDPGVGYIYLPEFYADFNHNGAPTCSADVKKEVEKLRAENVKGIIIDLRNNGGGSLQDVVKMGGLFIEKGPICQVKPKTGSPTVLDDPDPSISYRGPLVIMVNEFSASASEILAAAMQDYHRAIIIGSPSTYGKGTVQQFFELDDMLPKSMEDVKPLGSIKITTQKFYRINGSTTQLTGVIPDIVLPDQYEYFKLGEKENDYPLTSDKIPAADYQTWTLNDQQIKDLVGKSNARVESNTTFGAIASFAKELKAKSDASVVSLNWADYSTTEEQDRKESKGFDDLLKPIDGMDIDMTAADKTIAASDTVKMASWKKFSTKLKKDVYLQEAVSVINDMR